MSQFSEKERNLGRCELINNEVYIYESFYNRRRLTTACGKVRQAYWQGNSVHVIMESGRHYVYEGYNGYSTYWEER